VHSGCKSRFPCQSFASLRRGDKFAGVTQSGQSASLTKRKPVVQIHPPAPVVAVAKSADAPDCESGLCGFKSHRSPQTLCPCRLTARIAPFQGVDDSSILSTGTKSDCRLKNRAEVALLDRQSSIGNRKWLGAGEGNWHTCQVESLMLVGSRPALRTRFVEAVYDRRPEGLRDLRRS
jgi:hypothetical protein